MSVDRLHTLRPAAICLHVVLISLAFAVLGCGGGETQRDQPVFRTLDRDGNLIAVEVGVVEPENSTDGLDGNDTIVPPFPLVNVISTFGDCRARGRTHRAIDLSGEPGLWGLGEPIVAMVDSRVTLIGKPEEDPERFGTRDTRSGMLKRGKWELPRSAEIPGYGTVYFFTRKGGSWKSGEIIVTKVERGPLSGHTIRYMHLGATHPDLRVGDEVKAGQEIGVMGGTAVGTSVPHVHVDIEDPNGKRVDVAPLLGLEGDNRRCRR